MAAKNQVLAALGVVIVVMVLAVAAIFFTSSLTVEIAPQTGSDVFIQVKNPGFISASNVKISYRDPEGNKVLIKEVDSIPSNGSEKILIRPEYSVEGIIELVIDTSFQSVERKISYFGTGGVKLKPKIEAPGSMVVGNLSEVSVEVCNEGSPVDSLQINLALDQSIASAEKTQSSVAVPQNSCAEETFSINPLIEGQLELTFNFVTGNYNETFKVNVNVINR